MPKNPKKRNALLGFITESLELILIIFLVFLILNIFLGQLLIVTGDSMYPTLKNDEQILGEKLSINFVDPKRREIFIFRQPESGKLLIKRLIALPNEKVLLLKGNVYINGNLLNEPYLNGMKTLPGGYIQEDQEITVPEDYYLFLGDNREKSLDGREWGFVSKENLESRALIVYFPIENFRFINRTK